MRTLLVVLLALALGFVGYGHRMARPDAPNLSAFAMPDGTLPVLCLDAGQDAQKPAGQRPCPACVIAAALQMPPVLALPAIDVTATLIAWPAPASVMAAGHRVRAPPARGPPPFFLI